MDDTSQLLEADRRYLVHPLHHPDDHRQPLVVVEGRGAMLRDADGREYIDGLSGLWNVNVGHGRAELADAASAQMRRIAFASAYIGATNEPAVRLAETIVGHAYPSSAAVYFTTAGAESNESAFKFARYYWKIKDKPEKTKIISRIHAYHGVTLAAMSATSMAAYQKMFGPLVPGFIQQHPHTPIAGPATKSLALVPPTRSRRRCSPRTPIPSPRSSPSRSWGRAASSFRRPLISRDCARSATATTSC
jgi:adenosylmethionine-8-amino-7-oxononanoate aminotransferase